MNDEDFPSDTRPGRLTLIRIRHRLLDTADKLWDRLLRQRHPSGWLCAEYDYAWLQRVIHDVEYRNSCDFTPCGVTGPRA